MSKNTLDQERDRGLRKTRVGKVISTSMDKTAVVETITRVPHPKFGKIIKQSKKFYVHDEKNEAQLGDQVRIMETRPLSKTKRWRIAEILRHDILATLDSADESEFQEAAGAEEAASSEQPPEPEPEPQTA